MAKFFDQRITERIGEIDREIAVLTIELTDSCGRGLQAVGAEIAQLVGEKQNALEAVDKRAWWWEDARKRIENLEARLEEMKTGEVRI
jgi:hypothetical protein